MGSGTSRRVAIIGGGEIGGFIAERLSEEQFDVLVLDRDPRVLAGLSDRLDVASELGDATSAAGPLNGPLNGRRNGQQRDGRQDG